MEKTPKKKAKELVKWFESEVRIDHRYDEEPFFNNQLNCALKVCDEFIEEYSSYRVKHCLTIGAALDLKEYWLEVKKEIERLTSSK